jgi:two-component system OmpR family response regulator
MKVLLVEDNERVAGFVRKGLEENGHVVDYADNGRDGLFLASTERYDAMVLDRMLPGGVDGLGIIEALRKTGNKTPVLILSALADVQERIAGLRAGGDDQTIRLRGVGGASGGACQALAIRRFSNNVDRGRFEVRSIVSQGDAQ